MTIDLSRVKAVCFDVDGTLSDTDDQFVQKLVKIISPIRFIFLGKDVIRIARKVVMLTEGPGNWAYSLADKFDLDNKIVAISDRLYEMGIGDSAQPFQLIGGVREMLDNLVNLYPLSIISARGQKSTFRFLYQFELLSYFRAIATGQTCIHTKPYPDPIEWAAARMGVSPAACLMVGDTVADIRSGKKAGAQTVGVLCGFGERNELERAGADLILENTPDLMKILNNK
jgi:phosphoglycolate phosphatase-like HAD superfamily hydrolase